MQWAAAPQQREQMVLFATRLEDVIPPDHTVRMLDLILSCPQIRWSEWETAYHGRLGQPPIHTSVLAKVLLYGMIVEATVLNVHNEDQHLFPAIEQVRQDFGLSSLPAEVLVDGLIGTGANLAKAEEQYEAHRARHAAKMATTQAQEIYALRRHVGERPFAVIKHQFGVRQFLLRGLQKVQNEWHWATTAFNLKQIISWLSRAGPGGEPIVSTLTATD